MAVIVGLMSMMTWVPGLLLFALETYLEGWSWAQDNMRLAWGIFFGSWLWILILALLSLALSAWVKWKPAAGALVFGIFFVAAAFGAMVNAIQRTTTGQPVQHRLSDRFGVGQNDGRRSRAAHQRRAYSSASRRAKSFRWLAAWLVLAFLIGACLYMLAKIRGAEVVR